MPGPDGPCYSIVSSARARNVGGIVRLSAVLWGVFTGSLRVWRVPALHEPKNVFAPKFKTLFGSLKTNFPGCGRGERIIVWGTAATGLPHF